MKNRVCKPVSWKIDYLPECIPVPCSFAQQSRRVMHGNVGYTSYALFRKWSTQTWKPERLFFFLNRIKFAFNLKNFDNRSFSFLSKNFNTQNKRWLKTSLYFVPMTLFLKTLCEFFNGFEISSKFLTAILIFRVFCKRNLKVKIIKLINLCIVSWCLSR